MRLHWFQLPGSDDQLRLPGCTVSLENCDVSFHCKKVMYFIVVYFDLVLSDHVPSFSQQMMIHHGFTQLFHRAHNLLQVHNLDLKAFPAKVHQVSQPDRQVLLLSNFQDPRRTVVSAGGGVKDMF